MTERSAIFNFFVKNPPRDEVYAKDAAYAQRNYFDRLFDLCQHLVTHDEGKCTATIVGDHFSKSVELPVVELRFSNDAALTIRGNFFNYVVSVESPHGDVPALWLDKLASRDAIHHTLCEGFDEAKVYGAHHENPRQFTFKMSDQNTLSYFVISFAKMQQEYFLANRPFRADDLAATKQQSIKTPQLKTDRKP